MQSARLFQIVWLLQEKGSVTAAELAQRFEVSQRTIYRDVDALSAAGIPVYAAPGKNGGIRLLPGYVMERSILTNQEQSEILLGLQTLEAAGGLGSGALTKMAGLFRQSAENWVQVDFSQWGAGAAEKQHFETIKQAVLNHRRIAFAYFASNGKNSQRVVEPVCLCFKQSAWYLQAFCTTRKQMRIFKICRIQNLRLLEETFVPGPQHINRSIEQLSDAAEQMVQLKLEFQPQAAYRICDMFSPQQIERLPSGSFLVKAEFPLGDWVLGMLLSFGAQVKVLEPEWVKTELAQSAAQVCRLYGKVPEKE